MLIARKSMITGKEHERELNITHEQIAAYNSGALLQVAFPNLSDEEREFFKTGITGEEWRNVFGSPDDHEPADDKK